MAGCAPAPKPAPALTPPPATIHVAIPEQPGIPALGVTIVDNAGIVRGAAPSERTGGISTGTTARTVPGGIELTWLVRECDDHSTLTIERTDDGYRVTVQSESTGAECASSVTFRSVELSLSRPIGAERFDLP